MDWIGKKVSINLAKGNGVFQGEIISVNSDYISIKKCFHNGFKLQDSVQAKIGKDEIEKIEILQISDTEQETSSTVTTATTTTTTNNKHNNEKYSRKTPQPSSKGNNNDLNKPKNSNYQRDQKKNRRRNKQSGQWEDNSDEEFDFEKNLALFDKEAVFKEIEACNGNQNSKPDLVSQCKKTEDKYRHDENVLQSVHYRQIQLEFDSKNSYYTDEPGIIIPSIPQSLRNRIQNLADFHGFSLNRQNDMLARGSADLALQLLGGSRRLTPKNQHQWPKIVIICDEPYNDKQSEIGISTGRLLASHGLKVMVYVKTTTKSDTPSKELELFTATGNDFTYSIKDLPNCDLVILAVKSMNLNSSVVRYIQENRAPILAIDPPVTGVSELVIKCSILPILPLDDIKHCGKLYLCNLGIPQKFFRDTGVKYFSPFGAKTIIQLYLNS